MKLEQRLIESLTQAACTAFQLKELPNWQLERPEPDSHGDYATNLALVLAGQVKTPPYEVAKLIVSQLPNLDFVDKIEPVPAGFINFYLNPIYLIEHLDALTTGLTELSQAEPRRQILFEFGQPNTHKIPHIGHLYSYIYGASCVRLLEATGHQVWPVNYQGDIGLHVAKCLWAYKNGAVGETHRIKTSKLPDDMTLQGKAEYLQACYLYGSLQYEDDEVIKQEIDELNRTIYLKDSSVIGDWQKTRQWSLDYYRQFENQLGIKFDRFYLESEVSPIGLDIVRRNIGKVFVEDEGAVIFRGEPYGLHTRVFINKFGNPTYEAKDVGLAWQKKRDFTFDQSIVTTAHEQTDYWRVVKKAIELIDTSYAGRITHVGYGLINLTTGKMSSRTGQLVTAIDLVKLVSEQVKDHISTNRDYAKSEKDEIARIVALGAIKYSFLKSSPAKNITFDLESSVSFDGNSGPYLQYTYARCRSVLARAGRLTSDGIVQAMNQEELRLLRWLYRFPKAINQAATDLAPHILCAYLFELGQRFSRFYEQHQILTDDVKLSQFRLRLTNAVAESLKTGLGLLGIEVSERI